MMEIKIRDIKESGLVLDQILEPKNINLSKEDMDYITEPHLHAKVEKIGNDTVIFKGQMAGAYNFVCGRCLENFQENVTEDFFLTFDITPKTEEVEVGEDLRQEILLNFPYNLHCSEECRGLCSDCGTNLNLESCTCDQEKEKKSKDQEGQFTKLKI